MPHDQPSPTPKIGSDALFPRLDLNRADLILLDQLNLLFANGIVMRGVAIVVGLMVSVVMWAVCPRVQVVSWFAMHTGANLLLLAIHIQFKKHQGSITRIAPWHNLFCASSFLAGLVWGFACILLFPAHSVVHQMFLAAVIAGVCAGSSSALVVSLRAVICFILPALLPIIVQGFLRAQDPIHLAMGVLPTLYLPLLALMSRRTNRSILNSLSLKYEKMELIDYLRIEVSERKRAEATLFAEKERAQVTLESIGDAVVTTDANAFIEYLNPIAEQLTGWRNEEARGQSVRQLFNIVNENTRAPVPNPIEECLSQGKIVDMENHTVLIRRDGQEFHIEDSAAPIKGRNGDILGAVMVFHDVTDRKMIQQRLNYLAHHDSLTGLPNRALFRDRLENAIAHARRAQTQVALLFLDLDRFKAINDSLGHGAGDALLLEMARRLKACVREEDTVARLGGDEFTVILEHLRHVRPAEKVAGKIIDLLSTPFDIGGHEIFVTTSIGITLFPDDAQDADGLLKNADTAMYRAKELGRNRYHFYTASLNDKALAHLKLSNALRHALERNQLELHYQPKLNLADGRVVGVETLLRWNHPELGMIPPAQFIPLLEDSGMILEVGEWVLREATRQAKTWQTAGWEPMLISVNLSPSQFRQTTLLDAVFKALADNQLDAQYLELELTEGMLSDSALASQCLARLKEAGVKISLDDFGTGYSSLSHLRRFPIDALKIDKSFVHNIHADREDSAIVRAIIAMSHSLRMDVIAEGVETEGQLTFLKELGCTEIQGFWLAQPMPVKEFETWMEARRAHRADDGGASPAPADAAALAND